MCSIIERSKDNSEVAYHSTTYGVNSRTPLNDLKFFNVCDYGLPPDIMHDLLEGYVPYKAKLMLRVFIEEKRLFTLTELNSRIKNFHYGYMETAPTIIYPATMATNEASLNQSG